MLTIIMIKYHLYNRGQQEDPFLHVTGVALKRDVRIITTITREEEVKVNRRFLFISKLSTGR
jgi:hypothetical protein